MEVQNDHGLLVVSLGNSCLATSDTGEFSKSNNCTYTTAMVNGLCGQETSVVQLATPIQCIGDIRQPLPRIQQHITQLQPIQYTQAISYEPSQQLQQSDLSSHTLYQPVTVSTTTLKSYNPTSPNIHNPFMNTPTLPVLTPSPSYNNNPTASTEDLTIIETEESSFNTRTDDVPEPTYPAEGFEYFLEIQNYLISEQFPTNVSENYKKCLKKRANNYLVSDGKLYHNRKQPKEVIIRKDQQEDMLGDIHVMKDTGIHLGVKKMFSKLNSTYFWRGMYTDVVSFVKKCDKCSDQSHNKPSFTQSVRPESDSEGVDEPLPLPQPQVFSRTWRKVEVEVHGPLKRTGARNEYLVTMADPESRWVCGRPLPATGRPAPLLADFILHSFCTFGFARCSFAGPLGEDVGAEFTSRVSQMGEVFSSAKVETLQPQDAKCGWVKDLVKCLVTVHPLKWDKHLDHFLFQYRTGELMPAVSKTPFSMIFIHSPMGFKILDDNKENLNNNLTKPPSPPSAHRPKPNISPFKCQSCDLLFNSRISFRIHQRKHHSESVHRKRIHNRRLASPKIDADSASSHAEGDCSELVRESAVSAVKALLQMTREERRRRGKYRKHPIELQEQIAGYAVKYGNIAAVRHFSKFLNTTVSESTVRNLVKIHNVFTPSIKEEIGRFASNYGVEAAAESFSQWLKRDVSQTLVRKFKTIYLNKLPENAKDKMEGQKFNDSRISSGKQRGPRSRKLSTKQKEEVGKFAETHSVKETAKHFTQKLQVPVKERMVRRLLRVHIEKNPSVIEGDEAEPMRKFEILSGSSNIGEKNTQGNVYSTLQVVSDVGSFYQLDQTSECDTAVSYGVTGSTTITSTSNNISFSYQTVQNLQPSLTTPASQPTTTTIPISLVKATTDSISVGQNQQTQTCLMPQHSFIVTQDASSPIFSHFMANGQPLQQTILTIIPDKDPEKVTETVVEMSKLDFPNELSNEEYQESIPVLTELLPDQKEEICEVKNNIWKTKEVEDVAYSRKIQTNQKKEEKGVKKRGTYTAYSPEIRAEIGKYAAEHGCIKAGQHFAKILGHDVPESTARGLKEKYLLKKKHCQVTSLGFCQRGRPLRLGKYDEIVQKCLKDLVRSGEKVSAFLAITTAKEILNKYEPALLEENGGKIKLNMTWAKSFLKRIGIHNNS